MSMWKADGGRETRGSGVEIFAGNMGQGVDKTAKSLHLQVMVYKNTAKQLCKAAVPLVITASPKINA